MDIPNVIVYINLLKYVNHVTVTLFCKYEIGYLKMKLFKQKNENKIITDNMFIGL